MLPFAGNATPITYEVDGRQYVAIAPHGGSKDLKSKSGGVYVNGLCPAKVSLVESRSYPSWFGIKQTGKCEYLILRSQYPAEAFLER